METPYWTTEEAAKYLRTTSRVIKDLGITYSKIGGKRLYLQKDLDNYVSKNREYGIDIKPTRAKFVV